MSREIDTGIDGVYLARYCGPRTDDGSDRTKWSLITVATGGYNDSAHLTRDQLRYLALRLLLESYSG